MLRFIDGNDHFFLNLSMPAMKAMLEPAEGIPGSTVVTVMARNGTDFGIRVSATGDRWYVCQAGMPAGLWLPGFTADGRQPGHRRQRDHRDRRHRRLCHGRRAGDRQVRRRHPRGCAERDAGDV